MIVALWLQMQTVTKERVLAACCTINVVTIGRDCMSIEG